MSQETIYTKPERTIQDAWDDMMEGKMKLTLCVIILTFFSLVGCERAERQKYESASHLLRVECVGGYKFVVLHGSWMGGVAQMFVYHPDGTVGPALCEERP